MEIVEDIINGIDLSRSYSPFLEALGIPHLLEGSLGGFPFDHLANHAAQHGNCTALKMLLHKKLASVNLEMLLSAASPCKRTCGQSFKDSSEIMEVLLDARGIERMAPEVFGRVVDFAYLPGGIESGALIVRALLKRKLRVSLGEHLCTRGARPFHGLVKATKS